MKEKTKTNLKNTARIVGEVALGATTVYLAYKTVKLRGELEGLQKINKDLNRQLDRKTYYIARKDHQQNN